ncbi:hypothetical protein [uncultured Pseudoteredinibacter sp.]|uniref:hypothetical protein n=1 Tax=uncultured Pseudoteredinibacter sp. TaxID=1641701 RepID=UPI002618D50D|nr:hypothetical protein [uncultured Pseudoteredinibacter sp.]
MKAVFLCLLAVNAILFALAYLKDDNPRAVAVKKLDPAVSKISLLSERAAEDPIESGAQPPKSRVTVESVEDLAAVDAASDQLDTPKEDLCTLLGPFDKLLQAEYAVEHLASLEVAAEIKNLEIPGDPGFWVYLKPLPSRKEALRKLHELQAKGIDSYVIPKGDIVNGISFGMYSRDSSAKVRQAEVAKFGYKAEIKEVVRSYEETWVVVNPSEAEKMNNEAWQGFMNKRKDVERRENYCPGVASL